METGSQRAVPPPPDSPRQDSRTAGGQDKEETGQQMLPLAQTQRGVIAAGNREAEQRGQDEQDERERAIPATIAAHLVVIHAHMLAGGKILFNVPATA